jgi:hypothetical protein
MECVTTKAKSVDPTRKVYLDVVRDFLRTREIDQPKVKIDNIVRVDLDGDGEDEVLIIATNYFKKDDRVPMRSPAGSYSMFFCADRSPEKWRRSWSRASFIQKPT